MQLLKWLVIRSIQNYQLLMCNEIDAGQKSVCISDVIAPEQKWINYDTSALLTIDTVNMKNATFAGTYRITNEASTSTFPFRGEFDPVGVTIGWVVSYWNEYVNYHSLGAWTGYVKVQPDGQRASMSMTRLIAHEENCNTTSGYGKFILQTN